jgi:hypothetical protein
VADLVIAHLHVQAWDGADGRMSATPAFAREYVRAAAEAGAGIVLVQGAHAPIRGVDVHAGVPVLYDPGPLFRLGRREPQPHDFYTRWGNDPRVRSFDVGILDAYAARDTTLGTDPSNTARDAASARDSGQARDTALARDTRRSPGHHSQRRSAGAQPAGGLRSRAGFFTPVCVVDPDTHRVTRVELYPMTWSRASRATTGFPVRLVGPAARTVLIRISELSAPYGTRISIDPTTDTGRIDI